MSQQQPSTFWYFSMAWRDARRSPSRLLLFIAAATLGITLLVAIQSFEATLRKDLDSQSAALLGSDLQLENRQSLPDSILSVIGTGHTAASTTAIYTTSMAYFPKGEATRLVQLRGVEGQFPFYGQWMTQPPQASANYQSDHTLVIEAILAASLQLQVGDSIKLGNTTFSIGGILESSPGRASVAGVAMPVIYLAKADLLASGLITQGSLVEHFKYYKWSSAPSPEKLKEWTTLAEDAGVEWETIESRRATLGDVYKNLNAFFSLIALVALLLGCLGLLSAFSLYLRTKIPNIALLRTLGAAQKDAFLVYLVQVLALGTLAGLLGGLFGNALQFALPKVLDGFIVGVTLTPTWSWTGMGIGVAVGMAMTVAFAMLPLLQTRHVSPLEVLRAQAKPAARDKYTYLAVLAMLLVLASLVGWIGRSWYALLFIPAIGVGMAALLGVAWLLMFTLRTYFPSQAPYVWRQGLSNLFRPNNQTRMLLVTMGLGASMMITLWLSQALLLGQVAVSDSNNRPNVLAYDIQPSQLDTLREIAAQTQTTITQEVPIVTIRLQTFKGKSNAEWIADTASNISRWALEREYRVTYRDSLEKAETLTEGTWIGQSNPAAIVPVSVSGRVMKGLNAVLGDTIVFDVQGIPVTTYIASVRDVDFRQFQTNFLVVFPKGVLEQAPQLYVQLLQNTSDEKMQTYQKMAILSSPNVTMVELKKVIASIESILEKITFAIRFMAWFCIGAGLLVLISTLHLTKVQRQKETALLRTLGASTAQVLKIQVVEYALIGLIGAFMGAILSFPFFWALAKWVFQMPFQIQWLPILAFASGLTVMVTLIGLWNSRDVIRFSPLEVLRREI